MSLTLSDWFYEGILMDGVDCSPLTLCISRSPAGANAGFTAVARKHAGGAGEGGVRHLSMPTFCFRNQARKA